MEVAFKTTRSSDPGLAHRVWFIATESDISGRAWGRDKPFAAAADGIKRLARLARSQLDRGASLTPEHVKVSLEIDSQDLSFNPFNTSDFPKRYSSLFILFSRLCSLPPSLTMTS